MGNCIATKSPRHPPLPLPLPPPPPPPPPHQTTNTPLEEEEETIELQQDYYYDHQIIPTTTTPPITYTPDPTDPGSGSGSLSPWNNTNTDPRVLSLLEFFRQLHTRGNLIFRRITPVHREAIDNIFDKMGEIMDHNKEKRKSDKMLSYVKKRSNSFGDLDTLRLNRFRVKPIDSGGGATPPTTGGGGAGDKGGGGTNKPAGGTK